MKQIIQYIKTMPFKGWAMAIAALIGLVCLAVSWISGDGIVAVLSFVIAVIPAVIWFSDYQEYLKLQQNVTHLNEWRKDINTESIESPEWARVITDANDKVLFGIKQDGSVEWYIGVPKPIRDELDALKKRIAELEKKETNVPSTSGTCPEEPEA